MRGGAYRDLRLGTGAIPLIIWMIGKKVFRFKPSTKIYILNNVLMKFKVLTSGPGEAKGVDIR